MPTTSPRSKGLRKFIPQPDRYRDRYGSFTLTRRDIEKRHVCMMWPTETWGSKDAEALEVLAGLLKDRIEYDQREENYEYPGGVYHPEVNWDATSSHGKSCIGCLADDISWEVYYLFKERDEKDAPPHAES